MLKTYEDMEKLNKEDESFEIKEDKNDNKKFYKNDYEGYD